MLFKRVLRVLMAILGLLFLGSLALLFTGNGHVLNGLSKTYLIGKSKPDIDDQHYFHTREIKTGTAVPWKLSKAYNSSAISDEPLVRLSTYETTAFVVIWKDSLFFERYWLDGGQDVTSNSFSMAKTFTSLAVGAALDEGLLTMDQHVRELIPHFSEGLNADLQVRHLLQMTSGIDFGESYTNPFGYQAKAYYGKSLESLTLGYNVSMTPGSQWKYEGGNSVILSLLMENVTGQTLSEYFSEKIWTQIGAEHPAYWNLDDENGLEKAFSAIYATARDFARVGELLLDSGMYSGQGLIPRGYFEEMVTPIEILDEDSSLTTHYGLHYWLGMYEGHPFYSLRGMRGQYVISLPWKDAVVVRLGHAKDQRRENDRTIDMDLYIKVALDMIDEQE